MGSITLFTLCLYIFIPLLLLGMIRLFWPIIKTHLAASHMDKGVSASHKLEDVMIDASTRGPRWVGHFVTAFAAVLLAICLFDLVDKLFSYYPEKAIKPLGGLIIFAFIAYIKLRR